MRPYDDKNPVIPQYFTSCDNQSSILVLPLGRFQTSDAKIWNPQKTQLSKCIAHQTLSTKVLAASFSTSGEKPNAELYDFTPEATERTSDLLATKSWQLYLLNHKEHFILKKASIIFSYNTLQPIFTILRYLISYNCRISNIVKLSYFLVPTKTSNDYIGKEHRVFSCWSKKNRFHGTVLVLWIWSEDFFTKNARSSIYRKNIFFYMIFSHQAS